MYTFSWPDPAPDGAPSAAAPYSASGWRPDAQAVAIREGRVVFVGGDAEARAHRGPRTRVVDLKGATVLPGLVS